jgi:hypothetical protein
VTVIAYLSLNIWAKGWLTEPKLILVFDPPPDEERPIEVVLTDDNAVAVTDPYLTTIPAGTKTYTISLGDYLDAQFTAKGLISGFYFVRVSIFGTGEVGFLPLVCTLSTVYPLPVDDPEHYQYMILIDKVTGYMLTLPRTVDILPADPRYIIALYYKHGDYGRLVILDEFGNKISDTGYAHLAILRITLTFRSQYDMLMHMLAHSYGLTANAIHAVIDAIKQGEIYEALSLLRPFYSITWLGRVIDIDFDIENNKIVLTTETFLGWFNIEEVFGVGALGCLVGFGAGIALGLASAFTAGATAIPAGIILKQAGAMCLAGFVMGAMADVAYQTLVKPKPEPETPPPPSTQPQPIPRYIEELIRLIVEAKQRAGEHYDSAVALLLLWRQQGKITDEDYSKMKEILDGWKATIESYLEDIKNKTETYIKESYEKGYNDGYKRGYDEGYKKAIEERKWWIAGAGLVVY